METFNFGKNLRSIRLANDVSQDAMAEALKISQPTYSRIERHKSVPKSPSPEEIANALDVPVEDLMPPIVEEIEVVATIPKGSSKLDIKPKPFLNTAFGMLVMLAASAVLIDGVYQMVHGVCDALGTSEKNTIIAKWTGALTTMILLFFFIRNARK